MMKPITLLFYLVAAASASANVEAQYTSTFNVAKSDFTPTGRNTYFVLEPGFAITLEHGRDRLVITALNETKQVDGVLTRVVEEREWSNGSLVEVSRNYFAINRRTNDVYYFGEDVVNYKAGKMVGREGSWLAGSNGARFGLAMPAVPTVGARYFQEIAPGIAMDCAEVVGINRVIINTPAGRMTRVLETRESSTLEKGTELKYYAPGIGLIMEGDLKLVKYGK